MATVTASVSEANYTEHFISATDTTHLTDEAGQRRAMGSRQAD
jgi:hypothetical protein